MDDEDVRVAVYRSFAAAGRAPATAELADQFSVAASDIDGALSRLESKRHLGLGQAGAFAMAHPFSSMPLGFSVLGRATLWWGGCAWDSFALPHLLADEPSVLVATTCPACGQAHAWTVGPDAPPRGDQVAHFLVPAAHMWDDVVHTCAHQRIFCSSGCASDWLRLTGNDRGYEMDLTTLWRLASGWYTGRLDRGYRRREPSDAAEYLRNVGLTGQFWGLD